MPLCPQPSQDHILSEHMTLQIVRKHDPKYSVMHRGRNREDLSSHSVPGMDEGEGGKERGREEWALPSFHRWPN